MALLMIGVQDWLATVQLCLGVLGALLSMDEEDIVVPTEVEDDEAEAGTGVWSFRMQVELAAVEDV